MTRFLRTTLPAAAAALALFAGAAGAATKAAEPAASRFATSLAHYEAVRAALMADRWDAATAAAARQLQGEVAALRQAPAAPAAEVPPEKLAAVTALLPELEKASAQLAAAKDLAAARDAFYAVSQPLVRWHAATGRADTVVAYCPMAKRSWLQPKPELLGNPYYGKQMLRCGNFVA
jgi:hypothetical protein